MNNLNSNSDSTLEVILKKITNLALEKKLILVGGIIGIISLFFNWLYLDEMATFSGFQCREYWILAAFVYPIYTILLKERMIKKVAVVTLVAGLIATLLAMLVKGQCKGEDWMFIGLVISLVGVWMYEKDE